jgi:flavin reductase (DIM6/NTAB) family NADH-FMN oxidoreductase RutF
MKEVSPAAIDARAFRAALGRFASGVTVVTTRHQDRIHAMTASAFVSVSLDPPLVLVSVDRRASMHEILPLTGRYGVSVLAEHQAAVSNHFAGRPLPGLDVRFITRQGVPLVEGAVAHFVVEVTDAHPAGDHTLYIGRVEHFETREGRPLVFHGGRYRQLKGERPEHSQEDDALSLFAIGIS